MVFISTSISWLGLVTPGRVFLCLTLMACVVGNNAYAESEPELNQAEQALEKKKTDLKALDRLLKKTMREKDKQSQALKKLEKEIAGLGREMHQTQQQIALLIGDRKKLQQEIDELKAKQRLQLEAITHDLNLIHKSQFDGPMKLWLNQKKPQDIQRLSQYQVYVVDARQQRLDEYQVTLQALKASEQLLVKQNTELKAAQAELQKKASSLDVSKGSRQSMLAQLNRNLLQQNNKKKVLIEDQKRLAQLIEMIQVELASKASASSLVQLTPILKHKGKLQWPVEGKVKHRYGSKRSGRLRWNGMVIAAKERAPIRSIHDGIVVFSDWLRGFGFLLIIEHKQDLLSLYGFNERLLKTVGDSVQAHELIAYVGNSGGQAQPGLYFELRQKGRPVNPKFWLKK